MRKKKKWRKLGIEADKNVKKKKTGKKDNRLMFKEMRARKLTATEGSFKKGGLVKQGKPKLAKKGWR
jgi:hypothetical protein